MKVALDFLSSRRSSAYLEGRFVPNFFLFLRILATIFCTSLVSYPIAL